VVIFGQASLAAWVFSGHADISHIYRKSANPSRLHVPLSYIAPVIARSAAPKQSSFSGAVFWIASPALRVPNDEIYWNLIHNYQFHSPNKKAP
jgi:hypothetical protein